MKQNTKNSKTLFRSMMKSKIHRATVTEANLEYEGSITIDATLLEKADLLPYEEVFVYNVTNGERFQTYAIPGAAGSGEICVNGAAAHKARKGDVIIIATYSWMDEAAARAHQPTIVLVDAKNRIKTLKKQEHAGVTVSALLN